ncbi:hypothetical protein F0U60_22655 [Archangium minus]|uniref:Outer membrane protein beta-barrel domain-containing protein n=1 Tax=Archangium minus TaxID=83450 RepID=A0ABY9WUL1_9BACT|nr:hypothetical protein F0U61_22760 [Archangium violaceum]WNG46602.1 hypothetical protein F0U60_22655 [Archangium minus]
MNRRFLPWVVFTLCLSSAVWAQPTPSARPRLLSDSSTPAWLPRGALLGTFIRNGAVAPEVRLQWQFVFFQGRTDTLGLLIEPTASFAAVKPDSVVEDDTVPLTSLQLYSLVLGLGYTSRRPSGFEWGFQIGTGPAWYAARFRGGTKDEESYFIGLLDGRARVGYRVGPMALGVFVGYGDPYNYRRTSLSRSYVGGLQLGLYADWR